MSAFIASNGVELDEYGDCTMGYETYGRVHEARKEFYQHLRDKELGRWRAPEAPNFVVYTTNTPGWVRVVDENTGLAARYSRDITGCSGYGDTATRYFEAHPEPKPWHDAKPGEVWVLEFGGDKRAYNRTANLFTNWDTSSLLPTDAGIKSGYRIWPEGDSDG